MSRVGAAEGTATPDRERAREIADPLPAVRCAVRALLLSTPSYQQLDSESRRRMAQSMVRVCHMAASLVREELESDEEARAAGQQPMALASPATPNPQYAPAADTAGEHPPPERAAPAVGRLAAAQSAGSSFSGVSAERVAGVTRGILNAVSFPRFVTELINGVFKAMVDSSVQQMNSYVELLNNVSASLDGFADSNLGPDRARAWLAERYPASFEVSGEAAEPGDEEEGGGMTLRLRPGAPMPSAEALRTDLGLDPSESVPAGDPERTLVPLARRRLAKMRQEMLSTMVMLGMQRIVVESGRITASMRFHVDTRSAAQADEGSSFDLRNQINAAGSYGFGPWGVSASMSNTIGYVSTQRTQTTEEMNTDLDLNSSVEINFKSDYLPLNRLAGPGQADAIRANSRNPEAEAAAATQARTARATLAATGDRERREALDRRLGPQPAPPAPTPGSPGTTEAPQRARTEASRENNSAQGGTQGGTNQTGGNRTPSGGTPPGGQPNTQPGNQSNNPPGNQPTNQPTNQAGNQQGTQPGRQQGNQPPNQSGNQPRA